MDDIEALLRRVDALEARCARLETAATAAPRQQRPADQPDPMRVFEALQEYSRQQSLERLRDDPSSLAAIREDRARLNEFLAARGLPPLPDRYPELP